MKICYLADINSYHTRKWCNYFSEMGHEIVVISLTKGDIPGCKSYCFDFKNVKQLRFRGKIRYLTTLKTIKSILKKEKPDILHSHYASSYGLIGELTNYKPHIVSVWGSDILLFPRKTLIHKMIIKRVLNGNNYIFSTSMYMIKEAKKYLKTQKDIKLTPFGVNLNVFRPKDKGKSKCFIIGVNKSLERVSGINILIKAFSKLVYEEGFVNLRLRIAGQGSQDANLKKQVKYLKLEDSVEFNGYLQQDEISTFLQNLDIAVYPSLSESFGVAAVEAQACGIPIIASNIDGFKESTKPNLTSVLFETSSVIDLKNKIEFLYMNNKKRNLMGLNARKFVEENYDIEDNFNRVLKLYENITKSKI